LLEILNAFVQVAGEQTLVIGRNFIDAEGTCTQYKDIFMPVLYFLAEPSDNNHNDQIDRFNHYGEKS
jgi:hypothetical protein